MPFCFMFNAAVQPTVITHPRPQMHVQHHPPATNKRRRCLLVSLSFSTICVVFGGTFSQTVLVPCWSWVHATTCPPSPWCRRGFWRNGGICTWSDQCQGWWTIMKNNHLNNKHNHFNEQNNVNAQWFQPREKRWRWMSDGLIRVYVCFVCETYRTVLSSMWLPVVNSSCTKSYLQRNRCIHMSDKTSQVEQLWNKNTQRPWKNKPHTYKSNSVCVVVSSSRCSGGYSSSSP